MEYLCDTCSSVNTNLGLNSHGPSGHPAGSCVGEGRRRGDKSRPRHLPTGCYELLHESLWWASGGSGGGGQIVGGQASGQTIAVEGWGGSEVGDRGCRAPGGKATFWGGGWGGADAGAWGTGEGLGAGTLKLAHITKVSQASHLRREKAINFKRQVTQKYKP